MHPDCWNPARDWPGKSCQGQGFLVSPSWFSPRMFPSPTPLSACGNFLIFSALVIAPTAVFITLETQWHGRTQHTHTHTLPAHLLLNFQTHTHTHRLHVCEHPHTQSSLGKLPPSLLPFLLLHSVLPPSKPNKRKSQQLFLDLLERRSHRVNCYPSPQLKRPNR